jgi:hypothetical protein
MDRNRVILALKVLAGLNAAMVFSSFVATIYYYWNGRSDVWGMLISGFFALIVAYFTISTFRTTDDRAARYREQLISDIAGRAIDPSVVVAGGKAVSTGNSAGSTATSSSDRKPDEEAEAKAQSFFDRLVGINFTYIEQYYKQTQRQANKSFVFSAVAAFAALLIVVAGVWMLYREVSTRSAVITAVGVLCELISAVFFYLYNRTVLKMGEYHQKLVITQNVALALKISEGLPKAERAATQVELIRSLSKDINMYLSGLPAVEHRPRKRRLQRPQPDAAPVRRRQSDPTAGDGL